MVVMTVKVKIEIDVDELLDDDAASIRPAHVTIQEKP